MNTQSTAPKVPLTAVPRGKLVPKKDDLVKVYCRVRKQEGIDERKKLLRTETNVKLRTGRTTEYTFAKVFAPESTQAEIYSELSPSVEKFVDGIHVCIIAYGRSGTGKSFTLGFEQKQSLRLNDSQEFVDQDVGLMARVLKSTFSYVNIFNTAPSSVENQITMSVKMRALEIDGTNCFNVFDPKTPVDDHKVGTKVTLKPYLQYDVHTLADGLQKLRSIVKQRKTGSTDNNGTSSRSSLLVTIMLYRSHDLAGRKKKDLLLWSSYSVVDLFGLEKADSKEAALFNQTLLSLQKVVDNLRRQPEASFIYRDSILTYILKDSLSRNGHLSVVLTVLDNKDTDLKTTLELGCSASKVQLPNTQTRMGSQVEDLQTEINRLMKQVATLEVKDSQDLDLAETRRQEQNKIKELGKLLERITESERELNNWFFHSCWCRHYIRVHREYAILILKNNIEEVEQFEKSHRLLKIQMESEEGSRKYEETVATHLKSAVACLEVTGGLDVRSAAAECKESLEKKMKQMVDDEEEIRNAHKAFEEKIMMLGVEKTMYRQKIAEIEAEDHEYYTVDM